MTKYGEPWSEEYGNIKAKDGRSVAFTNLQDGPRIVTAVNALSGIPDPAAYVKAVEELAKAAAEAHGKDCIHSRALQEALAALRRAKGEQA